MLNLASLGRKLYDLVFGKRNSLTKISGKLKFFNTDIGYIAAYSYDAACNIYEDITCAEPHFMAEVPPFTMADKLCSNEHLGPMTLYQVAVLLESRGTIQDWGPYTGTLLILDPTFPYPKL